MLYVGNASAVGTVTIVHLRFGSFFKEYLKELLLMNLLEQAHFAVYPSNSTVFRGGRYLPTVPTHESCREKSRVSTEV